MSVNINIVGTINRSDINGGVPESAKYARLNPTGKFIQKFYRIKNVQFSDGTNSDVLQYRSERDVWQPSGYNSSNFKPIDVLEIL